MKVGGSKIYKYVLTLITALVLFSGCSSNNDISSSDVEKYEVKSIIDETAQDDFVFRLVSEEEEYKTGEVKLYGEITYTGEKDEIIIHHSSSAILFSLEEKVRGYDIGFGVNDIGLSTVLKRNEPYREKYKKSGGYAGDDPSNYVKFMEDFLSTDDFPLGYYVVNGATDFALENQEKVNLKATIDFKVIE